MNESEEHIALVELFRCHPKLAVGLVVGRDSLELPAGWTCRVVDPVNRTGKRTSDTVILVLDANGEKLLVLVLEVQLRREKGKRRTFASCMWLEQDRWDCDSCVLVVSPYRSVARWARQPMLIRGSVTQILAVGPDDVPRITDAAEARRTPQLAVLSAAMHGRGPDGESVSRAAYAALARLPARYKRYYSCLVVRELSDEVLRELREQPMHEQQEFEDDGEYRTYIQRTPEEWAEIDRMLKRDSDRCRRYENAAIAREAMKAERVAVAMAEVTAQAAKAAEAAIMAAAAGPMDEAAKAAVAENVRAMARATAETARGVAEAARAEAREFARPRLEMLRECVLHHCHRQGFELGKALERKLYSCEDPDLLEDWLDRVEEVDRVDDVFR